MNSFRQHIPAYVEMDRPAPIPFESTADLLALEVVQRYRTTSDGAFSHFAMDDNTLMVISGEGFHWWVVGFIAHPDDIDLPRWTGWKHLARLADGREVVLTTEVVSACGGRLTLRDGSVATDVLFERRMATQAADRALEESGICARCAVAKITTRAVDGQQTRIEDTCPQCGRRTTHWEPLVKS